MNATNSKTKFDSQLTAFWVIAYLIAWPIAFIFGVDEKLIRADHSPPLATILIYLPKFAFTISGVILFGFTGKFKEMWGRLTHWRVKWIWYALAYLGPAFLYLISAQISSDQPLSPIIKFPSIIWTLTLAAQSGIFAYFLFRGGLGEEIGLRGFALTRLQTRHSPLKASLIIGFWWGLWHLPAWIDQSILEIAVTWLAIFSFSMIFAWFYNNTQSLPIVMLLHAALNSFDDVYENIFPNLVDMNWELPYIAGVLLLGITFAFVLERTSTFTARETE